MNKEFIDIMNLYGSKRTPFLFIIDFEAKTPIIKKLDEIDADELMYSVNGNQNFTSDKSNGNKLIFDFIKVDKERYKKAFEIVQDNINHGNSFLLNLTMPSKISSNYSLKEVFDTSTAKYKLWLKDSFVVFSPEIFVQTNDNMISSFPMKGTIDASIEDARNKLLSSKKELAEHYTIVDLIRNDLSMIAKDVKVEKFQHIENISTNRGDILQMSSEIKGSLDRNFNERIGSIINSLLPAGSISGAPKKKTLEVIKQAEKYNRGFYTGVFGIFDGENIDSGVMIRFIEQTKDGLIYKSGGGITYLSDAEEEYNELIQKVYIPIRK